MTTEQRVLFRAATLIEKFGWTKFDFGSHRKGYCLVGAIETALAECGVGELIVAVRVRERISDYLTAHQPSEYVSLLTRWNDHWCRGPDEAIRVLREAAA